ncbi:MAG: ADP-ribosylglycohydrolase family protein [Bacillus sp. (in: firmicutes)]
MTTKQMQILSGLFGFCVGDALGVPVEFLPRHSFKEVTGMQGYGTHNKPPGTWSDDSSMTFCTVESLCTGYNLQDMKQRFCDWLYEGYWTHDGVHAFDVGITTANVLNKLKHSKDAAGEDDAYSNGNGSLMRILPLAFYLENTNQSNGFHIIEEVSAITHAHIRSKIACSIYVETARHLLHGLSPSEAYSRMKPIILNYYFHKRNEEELSHFTRLLHSNIASYPEETIKSSGYVIHTLEAAFWCLLTTSSYKKAVLKAVNLGEDTDTVGAVTGGLAGLCYGFDMIPSEWIDTIARRKDIEDLAARFAGSLEI